MATKVPGKTQAKQPAKAPAPKVQAEAAAITPAPVSPVADPAPVAAASPVDIVVEEVAVAAVVAVESVVDTITDTVEAAIPASLKEKGKTMADTVKNVTADMSARGEKIVSEMKTRTEDAVAKSKALFADASEFSKGNIEALVESGKIAAKGFEKLGQDQAEYARKSFEQTTAAFKGMAAVKSPTDLVKLHSDYVRSSFDAMVAQTSHSTEAFLKLAGEIAQPISNRFAVAAEKVKIAA